MFNILLIAQDSRVLLPLTHSEEYVSFWSSVELKLKLVSKTQILTLDVLLDEWVKFNSMFTLPRCTHFIFILD